MDIAQITVRAHAFARELTQHKRSLPVDFEWYPFDILSGFNWLERLLTGEHRDLLAYARGGLVADIGSADGDNAFFLESLGCEVEALDYPAHNFNGCRGLYAMKAALGSSLRIVETNLDTEFALATQRYSLAFFLGTLYHLKSPYQVLESLAKRSRHALISTRIARHTRAAGPSPLPRLEIAPLPLAYLVDADECAGDATNFWIFSETGLRRILNRTGWDVLDFMSVGNMQDSDPATPGGDERAFCFVRSRW